MPQTIWLHDESVDALLDPSQTFPHFTSRPQIESWQARLRARVRDDGGASASARDRPWSTCSVVGSSGALLLRKHGHLIDAADAVLRVNTAPTRGFEEHVGSRTT
jgi:hypothetical protein